MELVDPNTPATWQNWPAPPLPPGIAEEVVRRFGRRPCGCPHVRFAWGQTRTQFQRGKQRLLYVDTRIPAVETERHTLKRLVKIERVKEYVSTDVDTGEMHFIEIDKPEFEVRYFKSLHEVPRVIEPGWYYEREPPALEFIGKRLWWIERFMPGNKIAGGEANWARNRFELWFDPEVGKEVLCDVLGEFPHNGRYQTCGVVGEKYLYPHYYEEEDYKIDHLRACPNKSRPLEQVEFCRCPPVSLGFVTRKIIRDELRYREPGMDTVDAISEMFAEAARVERMTPEQRGRERFNKHRAYMAEQQAKEKENKRLRIQEEEWRFKSGDRGPLGIEGGGARSYVTGPGFGGVPYGQDAAPGTTVIPGAPALNRHARRAAAKTKRKEAA